MTELEVTKMNKKKPRIKRIELEYFDMNYIIINLEAQVIDVNGELKEYQITSKQQEKINNIVWSYENLDEFYYWPDKTKDHKPMSLKWRLAFYDEYETYYHKSGALSFPKNFMELVELLKEL